MLHDYERHIIEPQESAREALRKLDSLPEFANRTLFVVDQTERLLGTVTDGDIRRAVERNANLDLLIASDLMNTSAKRIQNSALAVEGFQLMENNKISQLLVLDESGKYCGIIHLHDLLSAGIN
jgi:arabinose-5-phosphate isomerase